MKKFAIITLFLLIASASYSQSDSTSKKDTCVCVTPSGWCITARAVRNSLAVKDSFEITKRVLVATEGKLTEVDRALANADSTIKKQDEENKINIRRMDNYENQTSNMARTNLILLDEQSFLKSQIRKEKRKTLVIGGVSLTVIASLSYLLIRK